MNDQIVYVLLMADGSPLTTEVNLTKLNIKMEDEKSIALAARLNILRDFISTFVSDELCDEFEKAPFEGRLALAKGVYKTDFAMIRAISFHPTPIQLFDECDWAGVVC